MIRLREERGAVIPIVVLSLIAIFGMVVLTVDVGGLLAKRRSMVNAADAAALAAAQSLAFPKTQAACGTATEVNAQTMANQFAQKNVAGANLLSFQTDCANQTVTVSYQTTQQLFFAPVLGFPKTNKVTAKATAKWGPPSGGATMPLELDPNTTDNCVYVDPADKGQGTKPPGECGEGYWFDNQDLTDSGWGLMNLNKWGVDFNASCDDSGGAADLGGWITQSNPLLLQLVGTMNPATGKSTPPTYVCTTDGGKTTNWADSLNYWATVYQQWVAGGKTGTPPPSFLFPINDPAQMNYGPPTSAQKYAIVGFAPMQIVAVYDVGKDPTNAIGGAFSCSTTVSFTAAAKSIDLSTGAFTSTGASDCSRVTRTTISNIKLSPATGGGSYSTPADYDVTTDPVTNHVILTWKKAVPTNAKLSFDYRNGGACPGHAADPNAFCLKLAWGGPQIIGEGPSLGYAPAMTVALIK